MIFNVMHFLFCQFPEKSDLFYFHAREGSQISLSRNWSLLDHLNREKTIILDFSRRNVELNFCKIKFFYFLAVIFEKPAKI